MQLLVQVAARILSSKPPTISCHFTPVQLCRCADYLSVFCNSGLSILLFCFFYFFCSFVIKLYLHGCTPAQIQNPLILQGISGYLVQLSNLHQFLSICTTYLFLIYCNSMSCIFIWYFYRLKRFTVLILD